MRERRKKNRRINALMLTGAAGLFIFGMFFLWVSSLRIPALEDLSERRVSSSTKIYDKTGNILLYDLSQDVRRTPVEFDEISDYAKAATIAIEDQDFYNHPGFKLSSFLRAVLVNTTTLSFNQGGSTINQQVVKNSILTKEKTFARKFKELVLALKLDRELPKDEILNFYLNEIPYGGNVYGIEEASKTFYGKNAKDLTLAESAYVASIPKAPTYYSPYGQHTDDLENRKNIVLKEMLSLGFITDGEYNAALEEEVEFVPRANTGSIKAPHFVFFVIDYLAERYGEEALQNGGFRIITTLDYDIQAKAEEVAKKYGDINTRQFNATNNAFVAIDPKTGGVLAMVGSRDYFDDEISGNFNVALAHRQPGSTFKPLVYAELFNKGYTPETILFDVPTQFGTGSSCPPDSRITNDRCYAPNNYTNDFSGPITIRNALAQSVNVTAVKALYLAGRDDAIDLAESMGIESLTDRSRYGLSLVLGGGEVSPLDMTSAYSVFANDGMKNPYTPISRIENNAGELLENYNVTPKRVLPEQSARNISSILRDNIARAPLYGTNSPLYFGNRQVAVKTGTTNDYRDAWIMGYTPSIALGTWAGNNDNSVMERKVSGLIVAPMWREVMDYILANKAPFESFPEPEPLDSSIKSVLRGQWRGGSATTITDPSGQVVGEEYRGGIHNILYWVYKDNPQGPIPSNPGSDPQFTNWEYAVRAWANGSGYGQNSIFTPQPGYQSDQGDGSDGTNQPETPTLPPNNDLEVVPGFPINPNPALVPVLNF